jgi:deazaflavin-dependent oxidoreductase (nitroreductase family)
MGRSDRAVARRLQRLVGQRAPGVRRPASGDVEQGISMAYRRFKRWLYKGNRPGGLARLLNRAWAIAHARGIAPDYLVTLEVTGRRSGRTMSFPLVMASVDGERYLVSMLGTEVAWVRNVKAATGRAVLRHGRTEQVRLEEIPPERRAPVLKAYLQRAPGARAHIPVDKDAPVEDFEAIAEQIPVFRVLLAG